MSETISLRLCRKIVRTSSVKSFRFRASRPFKFEPGQFAKIIFDKSNISNQEFNKYLSFSSGPGSSYLEFTKKLSQSYFSQKLDNLNKGDEIFIQGPLGNCIFKDEYKKIAFLIGGIGITPVISIFKYIDENKLGTKATLFYSNQAEKDIAFRRELDNWQKRYPNLKVVYAITEERLKSKNFMSGRINEKMVIKHTEGLEERIFFIFGPPKMVAAMGRLCGNIGCDPGKVKKERFIGY